MLPVYLLPLLKLIVHKQRLPSVRYFFKTTITEKQNILKFIESNIFGKIL